MHVRAPNYPIRKLHHPGTRINVVHGGDLRLIPPWLSPKVLMSATLYYGAVL